MSNQKFIYCPYCKTNLVDSLDDGLLIQRCPTCKFINWMDPKPTGSIIFFDGGKVLLLRRAEEPLKGYWVLPGGFVRYTEEPIESIVRETKEEIGLLPKVTGVVDANRIDNDPRGIHLNIIYEGTIDGEIHLSEEHDAYKWFVLSDLPEKIAYHHREAIETWYSKRKPKI